jgi:hypothetical protein
MSESHPRVFLSYSHDSKAHAERVLELANQLRADGVDAWLDQYEPSPEMGWPRWMQNQIDAADFILVIASPTYKKRFEGRESRGAGLGVSWEGMILNQAIYEASGSNKKIIPIVFEGTNPADSVPTPLRPFMYVRLPADFELLLRQIFRAPAIVPPAIGLKPVLSAKSVGSAGSGVLQSKVEVRLDADVNDAKSKFKEIQDKLRELLGTKDIFITEIKDGSARLQVSGDDAAIEKLGKLIENGSLSELAGLRIDHLLVISNQNSQSGPPWLENGLLKDVFKAAQSLNLLNTDVRNSLLSAFQPKLRSMLPTIEDPASQLLSDLNHLNKMPRLADGTDPLRTWLETAELLRGEFEAAKIFRIALESIVG